MTYTIPGPKDETMNKTETSPVIGKRTGQRSDQPVAIIAAMAGKV